VNKWTSGSAYLDPYLPEHRGIRITPLVSSVGEFLAAMAMPGWPDLTMPTIESASPG
jgi:hypothetical protein